MKKHIILIIVVFISFTNCQQTHNNKENTSATEEKEVVDTLLLNKVKCKATAKKDVEILLDSTVEARNDTLYFSYKVINNTSKNLLFFHIRSLGIILKDHYPELESIYPGSLVSTKKNQALIVCHIDSSPLLWFYKIEWEVQLCPIGKWIIFLTRHMYPSQDAGRVRR